jgi:hypothetical protein
MTRAQCSVERELAGKTKALGEKLANATSSIKKPTWSDLRTNSDCRGRKPATNSQTRKWIISRIVIAIINIPLSQTYR